MPPKGQIVSRGTRARASDTKFGTAVRLTALFQRGLTREAVDEAKVKTLHMLTDTITLDGH